MRPIQEKAPVDKVTENRYAIRQLQRRPAPISEAGEMINPWARLGGGACTVTTGNWVNVDFGEAMADNEPTPGDIFTLDDQGDRFRLILAAEGLYIVHGIFAWDDTFTQVRAIDLQQGAGDHLYFEELGLTVSKGPFPSAGDTAHFFNVDCISAFVWNSSSTTDPILDPRAYQASGVSRGCSGLSLRAIYLGTIGTEGSWTYETT